MKQETTIYLFYCIKNSLIASKSKSTIFSLSHLFIFLNIQKVSVCLATKLYMTDRLAVGRMDVQLHTHPSNIKAYNRLLFFFINGPLYTFCTYDTCTFSKCILWADLNCLRFSFYVIWQLFIILNCAQTQKSIRRRKKYWWQNRYIWFKREEFTGWLKKKLV